MIASPLPAFSILYIKPDCVVFTSLPLANSARNLSPSSFACLAIDSAFAFDAAINFASIDSKVFWIFSSLRTSTLPSKASFKPSKIRALSYLMTSLCESTRSFI